MLALFETLVLLPALVISRVLELLIVIVTLVFIVYYSSIITDVVQHNVDLIQQLVLVSLLMLVKATKVEQSTMNMQILTGCYIKPISCVIFCVIFIILRVVELLF